MKTANITLSQFFQNYTYRSQFLEVLNLSDSPLSFEKLRIEAAKKLFGAEFVDSKEFKIAYLEDQERIYVKCIERDELNFNLQDKRRQKHSVLPQSIAEDKLKLQKIRKQLDLIKS